MKGSVLISKTTPKTHKIGVLKTACEALADRLKWPGFQKGVHIEPHVLWMVFGIQNAQTTNTSQRNMRKMIVKSLKHCPERKKLEILDGSGREVQGKAQGSGQNHNHADLPEETTVLLWTNMAHWQLAAQHEISVRTGATTRNGKGNDIDHQSHERRSSKKPTKLDRKQVAHNNLAGRNTCISTTASTHSARLCVATSSFELPGSRKREDH